MTNYSYCLTHVVLQIRYHLITFMYLNKIFMFISLSSSSLEESRTILNIHEKSVKVIRGIQNCNCFVGFMPGKFESVHQQIN